jgi:2-polyprenyl-6-methoxyphenol hydroxylase-like FAD-dependent oxidoreductase
VWWFANPGRRVDPPPSELATITPKQWRDELNDLFKDDTGPILPIIAATEEIIAGWSTYDFPTVPKWRNDHMVIIGDAAHATSPSSGQGASMAAEDAVIVAKCLRDIPDQARAFEVYEGLRRKRVEKIVAAGKRNGSGKAPGSVGRVVRDLMLPPVMRRLERSDALRKLYEYPINWDSKVA